MKGLKAEPWLAVPVRREVERLVAEGLTPDQRLDLAGRVLDRHERDGRADPADLAHGGLGRGLQVGVEGRRDLHAAAEDPVGAELVHRLLRDPGREVGLVRVGLRRVDLVLVRDVVGRVDDLVVLLLGDHLLLEHPVEHEVAPCLRGSRRLAAGRTPSARRSSRRAALPARAWRLDAVISSASIGSPVDRVERLDRLAEFVEDSLRPRRSRCASRTRSRTRRCRSTRSSGTA